MADVAGVRDFIARGVFGRRNADRVVSDRGSDAENRPRHVAFHAGAPRTGRGVTRVRRKRFADRLVAPRANPVRARTEAGILFDFRVMNVLMASDTSEAPLEEALALPKPNGVVGEARGRPSAQYAASASSFCPYSRIGKNES